MAEFHYIRWVFRDGNFEKLGSISFEVDGLQANNLSGIWWSVVERDRSVTAGVPFDKQLPLRGMEVGGLGSTQSEDGVYEISIERPAENQWSMRVLTAEGREPHPWLSSATLGLHANSAEPPWSGVELSFAFQNSQGSAEGDVQLRRKVGDAPTESP